MIEHGAAAGVLAQDEGIGSVTMCGCGVVSLHLGGISLRMERLAFDRLKQMLLEAGQELDKRALTLEESSIEKIWSVIQ